MPAETATAQVKPFLFETDFEDLAQQALEVAETADQHEDEISEEEEFEEEIVPTFSEEEMERAKQESFEAGKKEGVDETMSAIERETRDIIKALSLRITDLFSAQEQANNLLLRDGYGIAIAMVRKLFPEMNRQNALGEVKRLVETTLMRLIEEPRVIVRVHPDLHDALEGLIPSLKAGAGYEGRLLLKDDPKLAYGDCRLEWGDGSAERNVEHLWQSIDQIIEENLGRPEDAETPETALDVDTGVTREETAEAEGEEPAAEAADTEQDDETDATADEAAADDEPPAS